MSEGRPLVRASFPLTAFEIVWISLIFFLFAGSPPPDVGESHYLVKAKHYWHPEWCASDLFLESRDAHAAFYWTFGWVTQFCSLAATAWIGRAITWLLLAWSWRRLSWAIVPRPLVALLSAGLMLLFLRNFHLAGEWIVGGIEAKGFAYVLVFLALEAMVRGRWSVAILLAGAAGAFHVLVGGWTVVAIGIAWLLANHDRPRLIALAPALAGGLILALPGLIPAVALNWGVPKETVREASRIYVFERLSHHLVFHLFGAWYQVRFFVLLAGWALLAWKLRDQPQQRRLQLVVLGSALIAAVGVIIDQVPVIIANLTGASAEARELWAAPLLRYYWFRMSDSLVPIGTALAIVAALDRLHVTRPVLASWLTATAILFASANIADVCYWRAQQRLPGAVLQPHPTADSWPRWWFSQQPHLPSSPTKAEKWYEDWQKVCEWIAENTPADAKFITPRDQQTFKWYAGRAEVVNWKDIPQDARTLVEWKQTLDEIYPRDLEHRRLDLAAFSDEELITLAHKHSAHYLIIDRTRSLRPIRMRRPYPFIREENMSFEVYEVPEPAP